MRLMYYPRSHREKELQIVAFKDKSTNFYSTVFATKRQTLSGSLSELQSQELQRDKQKSVVTINPCKIALFGQARLVTLAGKSETC